MADRKRWPWDDQDRPSATQYQEWIIERGLAPDPLQVICVDAASEGEPSLCGVLYVPGNGTPRTLSLPCLEIYLNGQLINANHTELLPEWARFVYGSLNILCHSTALAPKALIKKFAPVITTILNDVLEREFFKLSRKEREEIFRLWTEQAKEAAALDDNMFEIWQSVITLNSNLGQTTLAELMEWRDSIALNSEFDFPISERIDPARAVYKEVFRKSHGIVTHVATHGDLKLIKKLASRVRAGLRRVDTDTSAFEILNVEADEGLSRLVVKEFHSPLLSRVAIANYEPETVPALLMPPANDPETEKFLEKFSVSDEERYSLLQKWQLGPKYWTLILNAQSPLVNEMKNLSEDSLGLRIALRELFHVAYMFTSAEAEHEMKELTWQDTIELIERVCKLETEVNGLEARIRELEDEKQKLVVTFDDAQLTFEAKLGERSRRIQLLEGKLHESSHQNQKLRGNVEEHNKQIGELSDELEALRIILMAKEEELAQAQKEIENLRTSAPAPLPVDPRYPVGPYEV